ncbi:MAG: hypothetical protein GY863_18285 [bacterium]|nr:hypothetical protein [bacterium]
MLPEILRSRRNQFRPREQYLYADQYKKYPFKIKNVNGFDIFKYSFVIECDIHFWIPACSGTTKRGGNGRRGGKDREVSAEASGENEFRERRVRSRINWGSIVFCPQYKLDNKD